MQKEVGETRTCGKETGSTVVEPKPRGWQRRAELMPQMIESVVWQKNTEETGT